MDELAVNSLHTLDIGTKLYQGFVKCVMEEYSISIHNPIKKNSLAIFKPPQARVTSKQGKKIKVLQNNIELFGQLYISTQSSEGDLKFFSHEIQSFPSSLSDFGKLHLSNTKSELWKWFQSPSIQPESPACYDCRIMDGAATVHFLPTTGVATFNDYAENISIPYLQMQLQITTRIDVVWDTYLPNSLKESTQETRGKGVHKKYQVK